MDALIEQAAKAGGKLIELVTKLAEDGKHDEAQAAIDKFNSLLDERIKANRAKGDAILGERFGD